MIQGGHGGHGAVINESFRARCLHQATHFPDPLYESCANLLFVRESHCDSHNP